MPSEESLSAYPWAVGANAAIPRVASSVFSPHFLKFPCPQLAVGVRGTWNIGLGGGCCSSPVCWAREQGPE